MKSVVFLAAFAASVNGISLFARAEKPCCFQLNVTGGVTGSLGQLTDGQSRVGDNSLNQSTFCINSTGVITDITGKGCIITTETTQFQCDEGKPGTPGFSISPSGQLEFHGSDYWIACGTGQNGGKNIYTTNSTSVTHCKAVYLNADTCVNTGSVPAVAPGAPGAPGGSAPASTVTFMSTVTVSNCVCSTAAPGAPGAAAPAPGQNSGGSSPAAPVAGSQAPAAPAGSGAAAVPVAPAPGQSSVSSAGGAAPTGGAAPGSSAPTPAHTSVVPVVPVPSQSSAPSAGTVSASQTSQGTHPSTPCPSCQSASASGGSTTSATGVSPPCPTCHSAYSNATATSTPCPSTGTAHVTTPCQTCPQSQSTTSANATRGSSVLSTSPCPTCSSSIHPMNSTSTVATSTSTSTSCPTNLSGEFQFPHLIVRIGSTKPDTPYGTGLNGTVNSTVSTAFNFDIPQSYSGKTCSLIFLFPRKDQLETTSFSFSGDGKVVFGKLSETVSSLTTYNNVPSVSQGLGTITINPGNSYVVSTFSCPAEQALAYEMKNAGSTDFEFFEDWNPSPLGLFITAC